MFFSTSAVTDVTTTYNIRIGSNDKLHQTMLSLTKTSFPRTSVRIPLRTTTDGCLILLHYPARTFRRVPGWIIFSLWFRFARKRRRENSLEMTADPLLSRAGDSLTNPLNSIAAIIFYLSRSQRKRGKKRMNPVLKRDREMYVRTIRGIGWKIQREMYRMRENRWRAKRTGDREETTISRQWLIGQRRHPWGRSAGLTDAEYDVAGYPIATSLKITRVYRRPRLAPASLRSLIGRYICSII